MNISTVIMFSKVRFILPCHCVLSPLSEQADQGTSGVANVSLHTTVFLDEADHLPKLLHDILMLKKLVNK